ncbi:MAG: NADPH-dependent glutamate synthase [Clostridia bacterium]|jgi:glutamate synthase (NADPH) small chain|nr:NADPH-dependent glutamate synthase [Clostridia bacterium]MBT7122735.1 NADPH-dependent glutamate synthase [Clostridia bacterium]
MANMQPEKTKMPEQDAKLRASNFEEVALGYTEEMAINEANRCIQCKHKPCIAGCPVEIDIPAFIKLISEGKHIEAYKKIRETNGLPAICGRVCPQEEQCEIVCVRGIKHEPVAIGRLERYCADVAINEGVGPITCKRHCGKKAAVIGSGPAGLTCALDLAKQGVDVTIFEAFHTPGGVLKYGIPEFRLPKALVQKEIDTLTDMGVEIKTNMVMGKILDIDDLKEMGFASIFIGTGAGLPRFMNIPGENFNGVYSANEFLTRINLMKGYLYPSHDTPIVHHKKLAVIGGGNVAMDAARCAKRLGADNVYIVYRRSEAEMPARNEEIEHAKEEGIEFHLLINPTEIHGNEAGDVTGMRLQKMELGEPDDSGRRRPVPIEGSEYDLELDAVVVAIGQSPNPLMRESTPGLKTQSWGGIITDEATGATSIPGVYAGGDAVTGAATVILAMGAGKDAARAMMDYMLNE